MLRVHGPGSDHPSDCFGCKVLTVNVDPYAMPSRLHPERPPRRRRDEIAKGVVRDGGDNPVHRPDGSVIGLREALSNPRKIEREIRGRTEAARAGRTVDSPRERVSVNT